MLQRFELSQGLFQHLLPDGLEEIVDAVQLEGADGIFVVSCRKDHRSVYRYLPEDLEADTVGQLDVEEDQLWRAVLFQPADAVLHGIQLIQHLRLPAGGPDQPQQLCPGKWLVLYDQYFHQINGILTVNAFSSRVISTSRLVRNPYRLRM